MNKKKPKIIRMTEKEVKEMQNHYFDNGRRYEKRQLRRDLAEVLGLYDIFETLKEDC